MGVEYITHSGDDLLVVNAARVSFSQESQFDYEDVWGEDEHGKFLDSKPVLSSRDSKLINYLATHNHWTPFSHPQITVRVTAPIFVARQLFKSKVGMTENEISRRYVDDAPEFYMPESWRGRPTDGAKQGSSTDIVEKFDLFHWDRGVEYFGVDISSEVKGFFAQAESLYNDLVKGGVAPEQARMVLPQSMYTSWYWTGSLAAFARVCNLRLDSHAQSETRDVALMIGDIIAPLFPVSFAALMDN